MARRGGTTSVQRGANGPAVLAARAARGSPLVRSRGPLDACWAAMALCLSTGGDDEGGEALARARYWACWHAQAMPCSALPCSALPCSALPALLNLPERDDLTADLRRHVVLQQIRLNPVVNIHAHFAVGPLACLCLPAVRPTSKASQHGCHMCVTCAHTHTHTHAHTLNGPFGQRRCTDASLGSAAARRDREHPLAVTARRRCGA